jgi:hypothetical protein
MLGSFSIEGDHPNRRSNRRWQRAFPGWRLSIALGVYLVLGSGRAALAQAPWASPDLPDAPAPKLGEQESTPAPTHKKQQPLGATIGLLSRRSFFFPELAYQQGALTRLEKLELAADLSVAPSEFSSSAATSAIDQADDAIPGYGQGWAGYGKRFGSSLATNASANMFGSFLLASAFHQDPRYFVSKGGFRQKIGNALGRVIITRTDYGSRAPNGSGLLGDLLAEGLANAYLPEAERSTGKTFRRFGVRVGVDAAANVFKEYWPSIFKNLGLIKLEPKDLAKAPS